jgi:hypothetical protein
MVRFIITLIVTGILGGAIAYLGNQLGRYIGRKKLSIFRLRPRHTSILITTITGSLIAVATLLFAYVSSQEVRILFDGLKKFRGQVITDYLKTMQKADINGLVFKDREPILTAIIDGRNGKVDEIRDKLKTVVGIANEVTIKKSEAVAKVMETSFTPPPDNRLVGYIPEDLESLSAYIAGEKKEFVVMVFPVENAFLGEKFAVGFHPFEHIPRVFSKDEEIARRSIDGTLDKGQVLTSLMKLMMQAKVAALKKGMIENPKTEELVETSTEHFEKTLEAIASAKTTVTVIVKSKNEVDNRGPLEIYFEIEPASGSSETL